MCVGAQSLFFVLGLSCLRAMLTRTCRKCSLCAHAIDRRSTGGTFCREM